MASQEEKGMLFHLVTNELGIRPVWLGKGEERLRKPHFRVEVALTFLPSWRTHSHLPPFSTAAQFRHRLYLTHVHSLNLHEAFTY